MTKKIKKTKKVNKIKKSIKKVKKIQKKTIFKKKVVKQTVLKKKVIKKIVKKVIKKNKSQTKNIKKKTTKESLAHKKTFLLIEKSNDLVEKGKKRGFITYDEIIKTFPDIEGNILFLDELYEIISTAGVDVLEGGNLLDLEKF